jgi:hypothetical protein
VLALLLSLTMESEDSSPAGTLPRRLHPVLFVLNPGRMLVSTIGPHSCDFAISETDSCDFAISETGERPPLPSLLSPTHSHLRGWKLCYTPNLASLCLGCRFLLWKSCLLKNCLLKKLRLLEKPSFSKLSVANYL